MLGAIAGDVIGSPYEWNNIRSTNFPLFAYGARCTDDSILTIAVADVLLRDRDGGAGGDYTTTFHDYAMRYPAAGYGASFARWARNRETRPYDSFGNGSAMRVSPVGWAFATLEETLDEAQRSAAVTHNHPEGIRGAQAVAGAVFLARTTHEVDRVFSFVSGGCGYDLSRTLDQIRPTQIFDVTCKGTVPVAVRAFIESNDVEDAIRKAVSVGGDSDTIACIAGAIAHAHYGDVPDAIVERLFSIYLDDALADVTRRFMRRFNVPGLRGDA